MEMPIGTEVGKENDESGMTLVGTLETPAPLGQTTSAMSCTVMEHSLTTEELSKINVDDEEVFLDSDESEMKVRRQRRNKKIADPLKQLIKSEFGDLLDHLEHDTPHSVHILSFIKVLLKWKEIKDLKRKGMKYKILVNREECGEEYSVVIAYYRLKGEIKGSIYASSHSGTQTFREAIQYSKYFPIEGVGCEWIIFPQHVASEFLAYWKRKYDDGSYSPKYTAYPIHLYWVPKGDVEALHFETPRDIKVYELEERHVRTVNYYWDRHYEGSEELISQIIESNITAGAFTYTGWLVGWAFQTHYGAIGLPFTLPKFRKKGIGRFVVNILSSYEI
uniref:N-acetyltransferase domain-containing protein n=1 Tax=Lygus hesperus TaxID=30085 RepID=A0A0A9XNP7_LYGHE